MEAYNKAIEDALTEEANNFPIHRFTTRNGTTNLRRIKMLERDFQQEALNLIFIRKARAVHGDLYGYAEVNYSSTKQYVNIICQVHGIFKQVAGVHLSGSGCQQCAQARRNEARMTGSKTNYIIIDEIEENDAHS
ncbi:hypothetical protein CPT_Slocum_035 [Serratia phage Slocum]|nr:hypothetical protein CPT_Slocum_035 [Serratia phage Slocum]